MFGCFGDGLDVHERAGGLDESKQSHLIPRSNRRSNSDPVVGVVIGAIGRNQTHTITDAGGAMRIERRRRTTFKRGKGIGLIIE
ncbi:hypothetical protein Tco_0555566 [Tanacetum coccineum]